MPCRVEGRRKRGSCELMVIDQDAARAGAKFANPRLADPRIRFLHYQSWWYSK